MTPYRTFAEKDPRFKSERLQTFAEIQARLSALKNEGYYFRGQREASWKLVTAAQREWVGKSLQSHFPNIHDFIQSHIDYQRSKATHEFVAQGMQLNDISVLSTMQHFGGPTPFLDFTKNIDAVLFFAIDGLKLAGADEISKWFSIYAWKPDEELFNWERQIDRYGGFKDAMKYTTLKGLATLYIEQDSGRFLQTENQRLKKQGGLFLYSPQALSNNHEYEVQFDGTTRTTVYEGQEGPCLDKMACINIDKCIAPQIDAYLPANARDIFYGANTIEWSAKVFESFVQQYPPPRTP
jgi:hypothetical protein